MCEGGQCYYEAGRPDSSFFEVDFSIQGRFFQVNNTGLGKSNFVIMLVCKTFEMVENFANSLGRLVTGLVREFLEFFDLEYSLAVFDPESNFVSIYIYDTNRWFAIDQLQLCLN